MTGGFVTTAEKQATIEGVGGSPQTNPVGRKSTVFFNESIKGEPRNADLFTIRMLGQTGYIEMVKDIIKKQVASTDYTVRPVDEEDDADPRVEEAAEAVEEFLAGNFNDNSESFDHLLTAILDDILDMDSGVVELVPDSEGFLAQIIPRDGMTFTKNVKDTGLLPSPDTGEPAYYQFSLSSQARMILGSKDGIDIHRIADEVMKMPYQVFSRRETKEFSRDQIVWFGENPITYKSYGRGRTQKVKKIGEILLNGDLQRNRTFLDNEYRKGVLQIMNANQQQIKNVREKLDNTRGNQNELPIVNGEGVDFINIDPEPQKMQFLESHKWYTKLVMMIYGLNEAEAGLHDNANLSVSEEMKFNVWRRTTSPLLEMVERKINNEILPFMREYHAVDGAIEFTFQPESRFLEKMEQEIEETNVKLNKTTYNELRRKNGLEDWGDIGELPPSVFDQLTQTAPGFVARELGIENAPDTQPQPGLMNWWQTVTSDDTDTDADTDDEAGEERGSPFHVRTYKDAFRHVDEFLKEPLRNEHYSGEFPPLVEHIRATQEDVAAAFQSDQAALMRRIEDRFPEDGAEGFFVDTSDVLEAADLRGPVGEVLQDRNIEAMERAAEHHASKLENELEERTAPHVKAEIDIGNIADTFTAEILRQQALQSATSIEDAVKDQLRTVLVEAMEDGVGITEVKQRIRDKLDTISENHAELVARTETLSASRQGSQALAESTDAVGGKEWIATNDSRVRPHHAAMDGVVVPKNEQFTVPRVSNDQPSDYPRSVRVVGQDQPYNCRCAQAPVPAEDMPDSVDRLRDMTGVVVELEITERQHEAWQEHAEEVRECSKCGQPDCGDEAYYTVRMETFSEMWRRLYEEHKGSVSAMKENTIVGSKSTIYAWNKKAGIE